MQNIYLWITYPLHEQNHSYNFKKNLPKIEKSLADNKTICLVQKFLKSTAKNIKTRFKSHSISYILFAATFSTSVLEMIDKCPLLPQETYFIWLLKQGNLRERQTSLNMFKMVTLKKDSPGSTLKKT